MRTDREYPTNNSPSNMFFFCNLEKICKLELNRQLFQILAKCFISKLLSLKQLDPEEICQSELN